MDRRAPEAPSSSAGSGRDQKATDGGPDMVPGKTGLEKLLLGQYRAFVESPLPHALAWVKPSSVRTWILLAGGFDEPFFGGEYLIRLTAPETYPQDPPTFEMLTPNGVFMPGKLVSPSFSGGWKPALGMRGFAARVLEYFERPTAFAEIAPPTPPAMKAALARASWAHNLRFSGDEMRCFNAILKDKPEDLPVQKIRNARASVSWNAAYPVDWPSTPVPAAPSETKQAGPGPAQPEPASPQSPISGGAAARRVPPRPPAAAEAVPIDWARRPGLGATPMAGQNGAVAGSGSQRPPIAPPLAGQAPAKKPAPAGAGHPLPSQLLVDRPPPSPLPATDPAARSRGFAPAKQEPSRSPTASPPPVETDEDLLEMVHTGMLQPDSDDELEQTSPAPVGRPEEVRQELRGIAPSAKPTQTKTEVPTESPARSRAQGPEERKTGLPAASETPPIGQPPSASLLPPASQPSPAGAAGPTTGRAQGPRPSNQSDRLLALARGAGQATNSLEGSPLTPPTSQPPPTGQPPPTSQPPPAIPERVRTPNTRPDVQSARLLALTKGAARAASLPPEAVGAGERRAVSHLGNGLASLPGGGPAPPGNGQSPPRIGLGGLGDGQLSPRGPGAARAASPERARAPFSGDDELLELF